MTGEGTPQDGLATDFLRTQLEAPRTQICVAIHGVERARFENATDVMNRNAQTRSKVVYGGQETRQRVLGEWARCHDVGVDAHGRSCRGRRVSATETQHSKQRRTASELGTDRHG